MTDMSNKLSSLEGTTTRYRAFIQKEINELKQQIADYYEGLSGQWKSRTTGGAYYVVSIGAITPYVITCNQSVDDHTLVVIRPSCPDHTISYILTKTEFIAEFDRSDFSLQELESQLKSKEEEIKRSEQGIVKGSVWRVRLGSSGEAVIVEENVRMWDTLVHETVDAVVFTYRNELYVRSLKYFLSQWGRVK